MKHLLVLLLLLVAWVSLSEAENPNILFIGIDDLNDWVTPLAGHPRAQTPNIARLAERGMLFSNAHCAAPACNPSRAALLTGIRPSTSGVYHNSQPWRESERLRDALTLPQYLRGHGYKVLGSGKMFHDRFVDPESWDEYFPALDRQRPADPKPQGLPLNGIPRTAHFDWGPVHVPVSEMGDGQVADWIIGQLGRGHDKPFFLACGFYRPHLPWYVPPKYFDAYPVEEIVLPVSMADDLDDVPKAGQAMAKPRGDHRKVTENGQWHRAVQGYLASIAFMDDQLGRVLDALDASSYRENTVIVFWTDHGWHLGEKLHWRKFALWEEATRTPLIIVAPGVTQPGTRTEQPVSLLDLYPTILELAGVSAKEDNEGKNFLPLLRNPGVTWPHAALITHGRNNHAVRDVRWRYIRYADGSEELYDHSQDPYEHINLAGQSEHRETVSRLAEFLPRANAPDSPSRTRRAR